MDFIERWFRLLPDDGNGSTEVLYLVAIAVLFVVITFRRQLTVFW